MAKNSAPSWQPHYQSKNYYFLLFYKHRYDRKGFPYEITAENLFKRNLLNQIELFLNVFKLK